jgi:hypothetical protein
LVSVGRGAGVEVDLVSDLEGLDVARPAGGAELVGQVLDLVERQDRVGALAEVEVHHQLALTAVQLVEELGQLLDQLRRRPNVVLRPRWWSGSGRLPP